MKKANAINTSFSKRFALHRFKRAMIPVALIGAVTLLSGCGGDADAGADQTTDEQLLVTLDGSASGSEDTNIVSYSWSQTAGTSVSLSDATIDMPTFTAPTTIADESLTFELTVTNDSDESDSDSVTINVSNIPFEVIAITPEDSMSSVMRNVEISAQFNEAVLASSVENSFTVQGPRGLVDGAVLSEADTVTLTPLDRLTLLTPYTASITGEASSLLTEALGADFSWSFITEDGQWNEPELVVEKALLGVSAIDPQVAYSNGSAMVVWRESSIFRSDIWARRYNTDSGWADATLIGTIADGDGNLFLPQVAIHDNGNSVVVWRSFEGQKSDIRAKFHTADTGWSEDQFLESNLGWAHTPQVAFASNGDALAVWAQDDNDPEQPRYDIWANRYNGGNWGSAELISTELIGDASNPQIATDNNGNAVAVWQKNDGVRVHVRSSHYTDAAGWLASKAIDSKEFSDLQEPQVTIDGEGHAIAIWQQLDGASNSVWSSRHETESWSSAELISANNGGNASSTQVAFDNLGNGLAVWQQGNSGGADPILDIWANRYTVGTGWGDAEVIEILALDDAQNPQLVIDGNGNALAVWEQHDGVSLVDLWANRYSIQDGWVGAGMIDVMDTFEASSSHIAMDQNGNAMMVWESEILGPESVWASRFE